MSIDLGREDGIYIGLGERAYFANQRLSSSGAKLAMFDPPRFEHEIINGNAPEHVAAFHFGTAAHTATLEPEQFEHRYAVAQVKTKTAKAYKDLNAAEPLRTVLTAPEHDAVQRVAESVRASSLVRDCNGIDLLSGVSEVTVYEHWEGTPIKARLDKWIPDNRTVMDLKTCASASPDAVRRDIWKYRYPLSMGWYLTAVWLRTRELPKNWFWVFVEKSGPANKPNRLVAVRHCKPWRHIKPDRNPATGHTAERLSPSIPRLG